MKSFEDFAEAKTTTKGINPLEHTGKSLKNSDFTNYDSIHEHKDVKPQKLTQDHIGAIKSYTDAENSDFHDSSKIMNRVLKTTCRKSR